MMITTGYLLVWIISLIGHMLIHWATKLLRKVTKNIAVLIDHYGPWECIHSDQGQEFDNHLMYDLQQLLNIKSIHGTPYSPWEQGKVEQFNQTLKKLLGKFCY
jgi:IS30 family transposase